ncbi:MAG TPA: DUF3363 domain-containing protein [Ferrovibrio sp.]|uniref:DUF3363 domain-containing protein n=1 Tax=Ferrovibrio sp. TaxID=1917215 RepID=UPI002ED609D0
MRPQAPAPRWRAANHRPALGPAWTDRRPSAPAERPARRNGRAFRSGSPVRERTRCDLASGRFAVIEKGREFTLAPWRPVLECSLGKQVSGIARGETISWTLGRQRSGPSIS